MEATAPKTETEIFYNADMQQRVFLKVVEGDAYCEVEHHFEPILDSAIFTHDELRETSLQQADVKDLDMITNSANADLWLWKEHCNQVEGYGDDAELPENWKDLMLEGDTQNDCIQAVSALLACEVAPQKITTKKRRSFGVKNTGGSVRLRSLFDGEQVFTEHHFKPKSTAFSDEWREITGKLRLAPGDKIGRNDMKLPKSVRAKAKLYDKVIDSSEGYVGRIPALHKAVAVTEYFSGSAEIDEKK